MIERIIEFSARNRFLVLLLTEARFRDEASRFGLHSVAGIGVLLVLAAALAVTWHER